MLYSDEDELHYHKKPRFERYGVWNLEVAY